MKLITARNNIHNSLKSVRVNVEKALDARGYDVKIYTDYKLEINKNELIENIKLTIFDFQNEGEEDEVITEIEKEVNAIDLTPPSSLINDIVKLIERNR